MGQNYFQFLLHITKWRFETVFNLYTMTYLRKEKYLSSPSKRWGKWNSDKTRQIKIISILYSRFLDTKLLSLFTLRLVGVKISRKWRKSFCHFREEKKTKGENVTDTDFIIFSFGLRSSKLYYSSNRKWSFRYSFLPAFTSFEKKIIREIPSSSHISHSYRTAAEWRWSQGMKFSHTPPRTTKNSYKTH